MSRAAEIEQTIFALLGQRKPGATICPSDVARALAPDEAGWRALMPEIRDVARALVQADRLRVTRSGVPVEATAPGGPIRLGTPDTADGGAPR